MRVAPFVRAGLHEPPDNPARRRPTLRERALIGEEVQSLGDGCPGGYLDSVGSAGDSRREWEGAPPVTFSPALGVWCVGRVDMRSWSLGLSRRLRVQVSDPVITQRVRQGVDNPLSLLLRHQVQGRPAPCGRSRSAGPACSSAYTAIVATRSRFWWSRAVRASRSATAASSPPPPACPRNFRAFPASGYPRQ